MKTRAEKLLIFDCDGVLIDSEPMANKIFVDCLRKDGFDVDELYGENFHGIALADCVRKVEGDFNRKISEGFLQQFAQLLDAEMQQHLKAMPGIDAALSQLPQPKCVASGSDHARLQLSLSVTGLIKYFPHIFSATDVAKGKPAPDLFLHAAQQLGYRAEDCIVVEDSYAGLQASLSANMPVLLYNPQWTHKYSVPEGITVFHNMQQLPQLIEQLS